MLQESKIALVEGHDLVMFDLDGVIYVGGQVIPHVPGALRRVRESGCGVAFVTNNASRTAAAVADHLRDLGVEAEPADVVTSAQAAAGVLRQIHGAGAPVLVLGADGLVGALQDAGLVPVLEPSSPEVVAVVTGFGPLVLWKDLMEVAVRIKDGLPWVACNTDLTFPTSFGTAPGHGAQVRLLQEFSGMAPLVAGKPSRPLLDETVARLGASRPLMIGDRLDTDIEGAAAIGAPSLLVLTGVSGLDEVVSATGDLRPTYISATLEGLFEPHPVPQAAGVGSGRTLGGWHAYVDEGDTLVVEGRGEANDWWRVVASASWAHLDTTGRSVRTGSVHPPSGNDGAER